MPVMECRKYLLLLCLSAACRVPLPPPPTDAEGDRKAFWEKKQRQGIEVFAVGHEPEWSLEIDEQLDLCFRPIEGDTLRAPYSAVVAADRAGKRTLSYTTGPSEFRLTLTRRRCADVLSGEAYPWTAVVAWQRPDGSVRIFSGCARRIP